MRGSKINAIGTKSAPIIMTARADVMGQVTSSSRGLWGGLVILGKAQLNKCSYVNSVRTLPCERVVEGSAGDYMGVSLSLGAKKIDVRVSTLPSSYGERVVLRLLDKQAAQINVGDLGLPNSILRNYKNALQLSEGIILVTGPTGSGKTTTLYSGLRLNITLILINS